MKTPSSDRSQLLIYAGFGAVLAIAAALRLARIGWGLPHSAIWDEPFVINAGLHILGTGDWKPEPGTYIYGTFPIYVSALASGLAFLRDAAQGLVQTPAQFTAPSAFLPLNDAYALTTAAPSAYVANRFVSVCYGVVTVGAVYHIARRLGYAGSGLLAALLVALCELHVHNTSATIVDGPATMFMVLSLCAAVVIAEGGSSVGQYGGAVRRVVSQSRGKAMWLSPPR